MQLQTSGGRLRRDFFQVFFAAAALAVLALAPAIFPYGGRMVTRGDFMEQQIPFILETKRMLASGTPFWDWNTFLGANFFGSYAFYTLGSPFVWLLMPLPEAAIPYGISVMAVLKHATAAATAFLYLRRFCKEGRYAKLGGLLYAFSGFSIINTQFYHFMDVVAVFPLLLLALENAFSGRRRYGALALACALNAMVNYYFFFGTALFVLVYCGFRFFSADWRDKRSLGRIVSVGFECGLGCLLVAWLLMPAGWAMMGVTRSGGMTEMSLRGWYTWSNTLERLRAVWMPIESGLVHAFYGDASSWSSVGAFLPLTGCALVVWHYLAWPKGWIHALLPALVFISIWPFSNRLFTLGSSLYYTRWWYALALMLCVPTVQALEALAERNPKDLRRLSWALGIALAVTLLLTVPTMLPEAWLARMGRLGSALRNNQLHPDYAEDAFRWFACGAAAVNLLGLFLATRRRFLPVRWVIGAALAVSVAVNYAGFVALNDAKVPVGQGIGYPTGVDYYAQHTLLDEKPYHSGTAYTHRVDAPPKLRNYGMLINQPSVTSFHSLRSSYLDNFVFQAGFGHSESPDAVLKDVGNGAMRTLLGVKTYYNYDEEHYPGAPEGFVYAGKEGDVSVYENPYALPLGFAYDCFTNVYHHNLQPPAAGPVMLQAVMLDGEGMDALGDILQPLWERAEISWQEAAKQRAAQACYDVIATPRGLSAKIDLPSEKLVFFSAQFDKGWSAAVNGVPTKIHNVNMGMIGLRVPAGQGNEIVLTYFPRGLREGALASAAGLLVFAGYVWLAKRRRRNPPSRGRNPSTAGETAAAGGGNPPSTVRHSRLLRKLVGSLGFRLDYSAPGRYRRRPAHAVPLPLTREARG